MSNFKQHAILGLAVGTGLGLLKYLEEKRINPEARLDFKGLCIHASIGFIAASIPDLLEPANNPNHRTFFHSITFGFLSCLLTYQAQRSSLDPELKSLLTCLGLGYNSHLLADSSTARGLPIL